MNEQNFSSSRPEPSRRRRRTKAQIFKESYLPVIILAVTVIMSLVFITCSIARGVKKSRIQNQERQEAALAAQQQLDSQKKEAELLLSQAELMAAGYDYEGAISLLESFQGDSAIGAPLSVKLSEYKAAQSELVAWNDPSQIPNLAFQLLIADPGRAFNDDTYASSFNRNFVTVDEFRAILDQLYGNGYILVTMKDFLTQGVSPSGEVRAMTKSILLPEGKKPLMLTQVQVNYNTYLIDSDSDNVADRGGSGFASKLMLDENGNFVNEYVDASGQTQYGAYDLIPILEEFIAEHPDFSYRSSRAVIALTGYDGILGYRTNPAAEYYFGTRVYEQDIADCTAVVDMLRRTGYQLACYTYENLPYGETSFEDIRKDIDLWTAETAEILGDVDTFVFAKDSDIGAPTLPYGGERFNIISGAGFTRYIGFCADGAPWLNIHGGYVRQGRITVSGSTMAHNPQWFEGLFDPSSVLDLSRGNIPR